MIHGRTVLVGLMGVIAACGPSPTEHTRANVKLVILASEYTRADTIEASLTNGLDVAVSYQIYQCPPFAIERKVDGRWDATDSSPPRPCGVEADLRMLGAAGTLTFTQAIYGWMPDGEYRFKVWVAPEDGDAVELISNMFRIEAT